MTDLQCSFYYGQLSYVIDNVCSQQGEDVVWDGVFHFSQLSVLHPALHKTVNRKAPPVTPAAVVAFALHSPLCFVGVGDQYCVSISLRNKHIFLLHISRKVGISTIY